MRTPPGSVPSSTRTTRLAVTACAVVVALTLAACGDPDAGVRAGGQPTGSPAALPSTAAPATSPPAPAAPPSAPSPTRAAPPPGSTPAAPPPAGPATPPAPPGSPPPRDPDQRYEVTATVLESDDHGPELCVGAMALSMPPQCGGVPVRPFSWADVADKQSEGGTTWGSAHFTGTFDGTVLHLTERPGRPRRESPREPDRFDTPCPAPAGGWRVVDDSKVSDDDWARVTGHAHEQPDLAGVWLTWLRPGGEGAPNSDAVLNLAFTGDLDRHRREARARWGGPLCVTKLPRSLAELRRAQRRLDALRDEAAAAGVYLYGSAVAEVANRVEASVLIDDAVARYWVERRFGRGLVELDGIFRPVR